MTWRAALAAARARAGLVAVVHCPVGAPVVVRTAEGEIVRGYRPPEGYRLADNEIVWWGWMVQVEEQQEVRVRTVFGEKL